MIYEIKQHLKAKHPLIKTVFQRNAIKTHYCKKGYKQE